jgi:hypothetical protein
MMGGFLEFLGGIFLFLAIGMVALRILGMMKFSVEITKQKEE